MASNTKTSTRIIFFLLALMFVVPILVSGFFVIYNQTKSDNQKEDTSLNNSSSLAGTKMEDFTPITEPVTELQKIDLNEGSGDVLQPNSTVTVNYTGALASTGIIFESSLDSGQPATFGLDQVIEGWTEGLPGMKVGGTRRLIIPSEMAYGSSANGTIPANADLVFDVTLLSIN